MGLGTGLFISSSSCCFLLFFSVAAESVRERAFGASGGCGGCGGAFGGSVVLALALAADLERESLDGCSCLGTSPSLYALQPFSKTGLCTDCSRAATFLMGGPSGGGGGGGRGPPVLTADGGDALGNAPV